jgi:hypothetical protein
LHYLVGNCGLTLVSLKNSITEEKRQENHCIITYYVYY